MTTTLYKPYFLLGRNRGDSTVQYYVPFELFNCRGLLSMANSGRVSASFGKFSMIVVGTAVSSGSSGSKDTNGSQFFILFKAAHHLNGARHRNHLKL